MKKTYIFLTLLLFLFALALPVLAQTAPTEETQKGDSTLEGPPTKTGDDTSTVVATEKPPVVETREIPVFPEPEYPPETEAHPTKNPANIAGKAVKVENATRLSATLCGINPAVGIAAIPCLTVQSANLLSNVARFVGKLFKRESNTTSE